MANYKQLANGIAKYSIRWYILDMIENIPTNELAKFLGTTDGFVSHIKKGRRKLPPKDCVGVSKKFNIPLHDLRPDIFPEEQSQP